jgi:hypothetical protein
MKGAFSFPNRITADAKRMILLMLESDSQKRSTLTELTKEDWVTNKNEIDKLKEVKRWNYLLKKSAIKPSIPHLGNAVS